MISIYDWFGYEVPIKERYQYIKNAGFEGVLLWWSDGFGRGHEYREGVQLARKADLFIENIHTPIQKQNDLSSYNLDGEDVFQCYLQCIKDCAENEISTMVVHLPNDDFPMNWGYEDLSIYEFLRQAFESAKKLDMLRVE